MRGISRLVLAAGLTAAFCASASGAVLCKKRSGVMVVRDACKRKKEAQVDLAQFGAVGPAGPAGLAGAPGRTVWERPCPPDSALVGTACVDKYEASVWSIPPSSAGLVAALRAGTAAAGDLTAGGATEVSASCSPSFPMTFPPNGNWTEPLYAASVAGVLPAACVTWFQADQACALAGKRLATNEEWQRAAAGTPDGAPCRVAVGSPDVTGTAGCVSMWGTFDMVGNVWEWIAEWGELATDCTTWGASLGDDISCMSGDGSEHVAGSFIRGGLWLTGAGAGVGAIDGTITPSFSSNGIGFRCAR